MLAAQGIPPGKSLEEISLGNLAHPQEKKKNRNTDTGDSARKQPAKSPDSEAHYQ